MNGASIAKEHFEAALRQADAGSIPQEAVARYTLGLVISTYLKTRTVEDVRRELIAASDNIDPETDYAFMRP